MRISRRGFMAASIAGAAGLPATAYDRFTDEYDRGFQPVYFFGLEQVATSEY